MDRNACMIWMMLCMEKNYIREQQHPEASEETVRTWRDDMFHACIQIGKLCGFTPQQSLYIFSDATDLWLDKHMKGEVINV